MARAKIKRDANGLFYGIAILCPACRYSNGEPMDHTMPVVHWMPEGETVESPYIANYHRWTFNGDFDRPVFGPSLNTWWGGETYKMQNGTERSIPLHRCHSWIGCNGALPGQINYLGDCTHELANKVIDLPEIPEPKNED